MTLPVQRAALIVLDGWGVAPPGPGNAISLAETPTFDALWERFPHTELTAGGRAVGLPEGQMGNSEVGHLNLGAGAVVVQDLTRIDDAVAKGELTSNQVLRELFGSADRVHLIGLVSDGGVHSGWKHLEALIALSAELGVRDLVVHAFTDGRDTLPESGAGFLEKVEGWCAAAGNARIGSVVGRYYAMDRDSRWDRAKLAYDLLVHGKAEHHADTAAEAARAAYARGETDEFIQPTLVGPAPATGGPTPGGPTPGTPGGPGPMGPGPQVRPETDAVFGFNFRPDRMREITRALAEPGFDEFDRGGAGPVERYASMAEYEEDWDYPVAFPPARPEVTLASVLAEHGLPQLHVAETEKYAHVTYFFNGGEETPYAGEERELVPSPRDVPTYDHKPEMSAAGVADAFATHWRRDGPRFGVVNFANPDMVGHTGVIPAAVKAVEAADAGLRTVVDAVTESGGACFITADHGNCDHMLEPDGSPNTAHSLNPVPAILTVADVQLRDGGVLADVAPTILQLLGVAQPPQMTGRSLLSPSP